MVECSRLPDLREEGGDVDPPRVMRSRDLRAGENNIWSNKSQIIQWTDRRRRRIAHAGSLTGGYHVQQPVRSSAQMATIRLDEGSDLDNSISGRSTWVH